MKELVKGDHVVCIQRQRRAYGKTAIVIETNGYWKALDWMKIRWDGSQKVSTVNPDDFRKII